jgi:hypothetical protein
MGLVPAAAWEAMTARAGRKPRRAAPD